jgi:hypothetical protein
VELLSTTKARKGATTSHFAYSLPALAVFQATECIVALFALDVVILAEGALACAASKDLPIVEHSTRLLASCDSALLTEVLQALRASTAHVIIFLRLAVVGVHIMEKRFFDEGVADG